MAVSDGVNKGFHEDWEIVRSDPLMVIWWALGIGCTLAGFLFLSTNPPNLPTGLPSFAFGFAFFIFGSNRYSNSIVRKKLDLIHEKLKNIEAKEDSLKKMRPATRSYEQRVPPIL